MQASSTVCNVKKVVQVPRDILQLRRKEKFLNDGETSREGLLQVIFLQLEGRARKSQKKSKSGDVRLYCQLDLGLRNKCQRQEVHGR